MALTLFLIGCSLSMDAFSLALLYGMQGISLRDSITLSIIVGIYHFVMPLLGSEIGSIVFSYIKVSSNLVVFLILLFIGLNLVKSSFENKEVVPKLSIYNYLLFGLAVSIDSFSVGIGLETITDMHIESSFIFMICSSIFTFIGLITGKKINQLFGKIATIIGGITLIIISITYLFWFTFSCFNSKMFIGDIMFSFEFGQVIFVILFIIFFIIFGLAVAQIFSPKLRGKMMSRQIKDLKHMADYSKDDIKELNEISSDISISSKKAILDKNEAVLKDITDREANIESGAIKTKMKAVREGLVGSVYCKYCGASIDEDSLYCKKCGKRL